MSQDPAIELEMRIDGMDRDGVPARVDAALRALDPSATMRLDRSTGITHVSTSCQALEIEDALARAGIEVTAATG